MIDIQIQATNIADVARAIAKIRKQINAPTAGLEEATHAVAGVFEANFDSEGGMVGGWPDLSEYALRIREWQGVAPGPILFRYGTLRHIAVEFFQKAKAGSSETAGGSYPFKTWSDQTVSGQLSISGTTATLRLTGGYKVLNQWGHDNWGPMSAVPARPFWFVNDEVVRAAREGVIKWIEDKVIP